jgi:hypothetical protein
VCVCRSLKNASKSEGFPYRAGPLLEELQGQPQYRYVQYDSFAPLQSLIDQVEGKLKECKLNRNSRVALDGRLLLVAFRSVKLSAILSGLS